MAKEVVLTPYSIANYEVIVKYLLTNWNHNVANNFIERFEQVCEHLSENPEIFPFVDKTKGVQKCVLTKHNILYFKETAESIKILTIFDSRQDPEKLFSVV